MLKRSLTGAVILLITVAFVLLKMVSPLFFDAFVLIIAIAALYEMINAYKEIDKIPNKIALYMVPVLMCLVYIFSPTVLMALALNLLIAMVLLVYLLTNDIIEFARDRRNGTTEPNVSVLNQKLFEKTKISMMIYAYPLLPISFLFAINHLPYEIGYIGIILVFVVAMLTDTCAYLVGKFFGKTKFVPEVSPNKTVAGLVGGFLGGIIGSLACYFIFYYTDMFSVLNIAGQGVSITAFLLIAVIGSFINQLGDLVASAFKRKINIKDYGNIFPGHGGFMDRYDGTMFVAVFVYLILVVFFV